MRKFHFLTILLLSTLLAWGQQGDTSKTASKAVSGEKTEVHNDDDFGTEPAPVVSHHQLSTAGGVLRYTATAGRYILKPENGSAEAALFFTAYTLEGESQRGRPVTFVFNGGPGTGTAWLHMGALGPRKIKLDAGGFVPAPPYSVIDNPDTLLDRTDLVFIDAPGTGYSRVKPEFAKKYYSVPGDIEAFGKFIRLYLTRNQRWHSPLFLFGESYGTTRAAGLVNHLIDDAIPVNGVALLSLGLDFQALNPGNLNDLPYELLIPSFTMVAAYHKKLAPELAADLPATLKEAERWASLEYAHALARGSALSKEEREKAVMQLAAFTGLKKDLIEEQDLRIDTQTFMNNLLKDQHLEVGRIDGRVAAPAPQSTARVPFYDPSMAAMFPAFSGAMNLYAQTELGYKTDIAYKIYNFEEVASKWEWGNAIQGYPQTAGALQSAMVKDRYLKVLAMSGMYDLATPYFATEYTLNHLHLTPRYQKNITVANFKGGHMIYNDAVVLKEMKHTLDVFYQETLGK